MESTPKSQTRAARFGRHVRHNLVGYTALIVAVSMTPIPSYAANLAIGTSGIKNGAVTAPKIKNGAVKAPKIAANAVRSPKILDGSVQKADLAAAARGYTKIVTKRVDDPGVASGADSSVVVNCPTGGVAIGGGGYAVPTGLALPGTTFGLQKLSVPMNDGTPFDFTAGDDQAPDSWKTVINNSLVAATTVRHYAICAFK